jgi:lysophospholipase L1-like esterase
MTTIVLLVVAIVGVLYFNMYLPGGDGPAGPDVPSEPFKKVWSEQKVVLLGIGDSVTAGFGSPKELSYFDRLIKNQPQEGEDMVGKSLSAVFPRLEAKNIAVSGSTSKDHYEQIPNMEVQPSDVLGLVVMTSGGNDIIHNYGRKPPKENAMYGATLDQAERWIKNFEKRLDEMIVNITEKFPGGCHIFLGNIYDPSDGTGNTGSWLTGLPAWPDGLLILEAYNKIISECAGKYDNVHLVDIHGLFLGHGIHCRKFWLKNYCWRDPHYWYQLNIIEDPSIRGYDALRRLYLIEIAKVFHNNKPLKP